MPMSGHEVVGVAVALTLGTELLRTRDGGSLERLPQIQHESLHAGVPNRRRNGATHREELAEAPQILRECL
jgi:hypothetical protein